MADGYLPGRSTRPVRMAARLSVHHSGTFGKIVMARLRGPRLANPEAHCREWRHRSWSEEEEEEEEEEKEINLSRQSSDLANCEFPESGFLNI